MKKYLLFFTVLLLIGIGLVVGQVILSRQPAQLELAPVAGKDFGGDFTLYNGDKPVSLSDFQGKVVLLYFGYASCPDFCPTSLAMWGAAMKRLPAEQAEQVQGILISVDPERDHGEKLMQYAQHFYPGFIGITGSLPELQQIARNYGSFFEKEDSTSALGYLVNHTSKTYVIGKGGKLAQLLPQDMTVPEIVDAVQKALN